MTAPAWLAELSGLLPAGTVSGLFTDTAALSAIVGVASPWVIAFVQQPQWSTRVRKLVAVAASVVLGTLTSIATGSFADGPVSIGGAIAIVLVASQSTYKSLAQPTAGKMRTEKATSPKRKRKRKPPATPVDQPDRPVEPPVRPAPEPDPVPRPVASGDARGRHAAPE
jgi:hypothetical protein